MLTRRQDKARRVVMWAAGLVLVLSATAWIESLWGMAWVRPDGFVTLRLVRGWVGLSNYCDSKGTGLFFFEFGANLDWTPSLYVGGGYWSIILPLWIPAIGAGLILVSVLLVGGRGRAHEGLCPTCNYDLTGIDGVCPECGRPPC